MDIATALNAFSALSHPVRHGCFRQLVEAYPKSLAAGEIGAALGVKPSTLSPHLGVLERAGLAKSVKDGTRVLFTLVPDQVNALVNHLVEDCCSGRPDVCGVSLTNTCEPEATA